jgi:indole-3-glycerol phosphate synthase
MPDLSHIREIKLRHLVSRKEQLPLVDIVSVFETLHPTKSVSQIIAAHPNQLNCFIEYESTLPESVRKGITTSPAKIAREFVAGGARAISIVTDETAFHGSWQNCQQIRSAVEVPIIRKDIIIDEYQLYETRYLGADAVILITGLLKSAEFLRFVTLANELDIECIAECTSKKEIDRAVDSGLSMIAVHNRPLGSAESLLDTSLMLKRFIPNHLMSISEHGIRNPHHVKLLRDAGYDAMIIDDHLAKQVDRTEALRKLQKSEE